MDYGMEDKNPIDNVYFYCKSNFNQPITIAKEQVTTYVKKYICVYCSGIWQIWIVNLHFTCRLGPKVN